MQHSAVDIAGPHYEHYMSLFRQLNPTNAPDVEAPVAAQFLKSSGIDMSFLSQIWEIADYRHVGRLDQAGCFTAFKLVAAVQNGHPPLAAALSGQFPPPTFAASGRASTMSEPVDWDVTEAEQQKYSVVFDQLGPSNGKLTGDQVRPVLLNSTLPAFKLARIWELADVDGDGMLDRVEMYVALHLVYKALDNEVLPERLPLSLCHPTKRHLLISAPSRRQSASISGSPAPRYGSGLTHASRTSSISSLNRSVLDGPAEAGSPANTVRSILDPSNMDVLDVSATEADFTRFDTDFDGFVNGMDVKEPLMASGLPQMTLAKLWSLVDMAHTGKLNHSQFTILIQLVRECRHGILLPDRLPPHLLAWASAANTPTKPQIPSSPRIDELNEEIKLVQEEGRQAERDLHQLDADTSLKNTEIKNAEIELSTLSATVKQLRTQRGEAQRRLADLDERICRLEAQCDELAQRLKAEEERVSNVRDEIRKGEDNREGEEQVAKSLRDELRSLDSQYAQEQGALTRERAHFESVTDDLSRMERNADVNADKAAKLEAQIAEIEKELKAAEELESPKGNEEVLFKQFQQLTMNNGSAFGNEFRRPSESADSTNAASRPLYDTVAVDPFKSDPFESSSKDAGFGSDPFGAANHRPAAAADPFGNDPFAAGAAPTTKPEPPAANGGNSSTFANFANFAQFAN